MLIDDHFNVRVRAERQDGRVLDTVFAVSALNSAVARARAIKRAERALGEQLPASAEINVKRDAGLHAGVLS